MFREFLVENVIQTATDDFEQCGMFSLHTTTKSFLSSEKSCGKVKLLRKCVFNKVKIFSSRLKFRPVVTPTNFDQ